MASSRKGEQVDLLPKGFLEDIAAELKDRSLTEGLFPPVPYSEDRRAFIRELTVILARQEHDRLAVLAAVAIAGVSAWRDVLINYIGQKKREPYSSHERRIILEEQAQDGVQVAKGRKKGGAKSAMTRKGNAEVWQDRCVTDARKMLANGIAPHNLASMLASKIVVNGRNVSARRVRAVLQAKRVLEEKRK